MKDKYKIKIFLDVDTLEEVAIFEDDFPNLHKIFKDYAVFIIDMTDEELDSCLNDSESDFAQFCNSNNLSTRADKGVLIRMLHNKSELLENCRSIFILDISKASAEKLSSELGVLVLSKQNLDDSIFNTPYFRYRFVKDAKIQENAISEWKSVLTRAMWLPSNSIIISDDYLFSAASVDISEYEANIEGILEAILPDKLSVDVEYHVLICTKHPNCSEEKCNQVLGHIKSYIKPKRPYNILIEYIFHDSLHQRKIISNYNILVADKGFVIFNSIKNKVIDTNSTYLCTVFQNITDSIGDTEYGMATADMKDICRIASDVKAMNKGGVNDYTKRIVGDCALDKSIRNRLLCSCMD